ncbi:MAG: hypothetical protein ACK59M_11055 [Pseudomonadota bacterium]|jgi:hypothetical protein
MDPTNGLAGLAAQLLGTAGGRPGDTAGRGDAGAVLAAQVAVALGVARPAGERTLMAQDNLALRLLLEERRALGVEASPNALDAALRCGDLILAARGAARGAAGPGAAPVRGLSVLLGPGDGAPVCAFTHEAALRRFAGGAPVTAWVTACRRVWEFALHVMDREVVVDPGESSELHVPSARLRRLVA